MVEKFLFYLPPILMALTVLISGKRRKNTAGEQFSLATGWFYCLDFQYLDFTFWKFPWELLAKGSLVVVVLECGFFFIWNKAFNSRWFKAVFNLKRVFSAWVQYNTVFSSTFDVWKSAQICCSNGSRLLVSFSRAYSKLPARSKTLTWKAALKHI